MAVSEKEYLQQLKLLLPPGPAWPRGDTASMLAMMLEVFSVELSRADSRTRALVVEADPRFAIETFNEWLTQWGLPDECLKAWTDTSNATLRTLLIQKITTQGSQSKSYFIELARLFGYTIVIDEFRRHTVASTAIEVLADHRWPHWWRVNVLQSVGSKMDYHDVNGGTHEPLAWWGDATIECLIRRYAPAHTNLIFGYFADAEE